MCRRFVRTELTRAERVVTACVARGLSNREIAYELKKSEPTVKNQLTKVYRIFGVKRRYHMAELFGHGGVAV